ncbi:hypothetical protein [Hahella sp. HN01]|uniref:hypothetical protein n=1 Tax=unclassified Hahella TaxID=2624107 RepID=UPI001C1EBE7C|nr:hypothetical protein [Hahella sp. HN01]MBU6953999.1 hypothetical protein [Hahella sp. HN01]
MEDIYEGIDQAQKALQTDHAWNAEALALVQGIEGVIRRKLPSEIVALLINADGLPEDSALLFMGYDPIPVKAISDMYKNPQTKHGCQFLANYEFNKEWILEEGSELSLLNDLEGEVDDEVLVDDLKRLLPLFDGDGYYMALFFKDNQETEIVIVTEDYGVSSFAPSLSEHLSNLKSGLQKGVFNCELDDEGGFEIELPEFWSERVEAVS